MYRLKYLINGIIGVNEASHCNELFKFYNDKQGFLPPLGRGAEASIQLLNSISLVSKIFEKELKILEIGCGVSTQFISQTVNVSRHVVIEQSVEWQLVKNRKIEYAQNLEMAPRIDYDLVIVDGPLGKKTNSRPEILANLDLLQSRPIIMFDDTHRIGEYMTVKKLNKSLNDYSLFSVKGLKYHHLFIPNSLLNVYFQTR